LAIKISRSLVRTPLGYKTLQSPVTNILRTYGVIPTYNNMMKSIKLYLIFLIGIMVFAGCNRRAANLEPDNTYTLTGTLVKNLDIDQLLVIAAFKRNDTTLNRAIINIGNDTLANAANQYIFTYDDPSDLAAGDYYLKIKDTVTAWSDSVLFTVPGDFAIDTLSGIPENRVYRTSNTVSISFLISLESDGYLYAIAHEDSTYSNHGFSEYVTSGAASVTIDKEQMTFPENINDTIRYEVYMYSYTGTPSNTPFLPVVLNTELLNDNISKLDFTGNFGVVMVTPRDSLVAVTQ